MKHKKLFFRLCSLFLLLTLCSIQTWGDVISLYANGFENGAGTWSGTSVTSNTSTSRTGSKSINVVYTGSTSTKNATQEFSTTPKSSDYLHIIGYAKGGDGSVKACIGFNSGKKSSETALSSSTWTRLTYTGTGITSKTIIVYKSNSKADAIFDDIIAYEDESSSIDLTAPSKATSASATTSTISWTNGSDSGTGATGIQATLIFHRKSGTVGSNDLNLNSQGVYPDNATVGNWELLSASVASTETSYAGTFTAGDEYAIVHRDLAYNYSTPTYAVVPPPTAYLKNTMNWANAYAYFLGSNSYWDESNGSGSSGRSDAVTMTYDANTGLFSCPTTQNGGYVAFTKDKQDNYGNFYNTEAIYCNNNFEYDKVAVVPVTNSETKNGTKYYASPNKANLEFKTVAEASGTGYYLPGGFNSWETKGNEFALVNSVLTYTKELAANTTYEFKVYNQGKFYGWGNTSGSHHTFTETGSKDVYDGNNNLKITTSVQGTYTFTFNQPSSNNITVTFPTARTVTYNINGASGTAPTQANVGKGVEITLASASGLSKTGHDFSGWKCNINNEIYQAGAKYTMTDANTTFTAQWTPKNYTLTWALDGGTAGTGEITTAGPVAYGTVLKYTVAPTKTGYDFSAWSPTMTSGTTTMPANDQTYTAQWTAKNYTVTLDKNDHGSAGGSFKVDFGATSVTNFSGATPAATYAVDGYYTAASGGSKVLDASGNIQKNVSGWTTSDGKWNKDGSELKLYAHYEDVAPTSVTISGEAQYCPGQTISLSAAVEGARSKPTYSWKRGDTEVGTDATLSINPCSSSHAGSYTCTVTNGSASMTSEAYVVKVYTLTLVEGSSSQSIDFTHQSGKIGSFTKDLNENFTYGIKVSDGVGNWYGNQGTMKNTNSTNWPLDKNENMYLLTSCTGTYTFTLDYSYSHDFGSGTKYLALTVTYPKHDQVKDYPIYFDKGTFDWSNIYYRIGAASTLCSEPMTEVPGTDRLYQTTTKEYNSFLAWHICNNTGWTGDNSVYRTKTNDDQSSIAITNSIAFDKDIVPEGGVTIVPGSQHSTGEREENNNCEFYEYSKSAGLLTHKATISSYDSDQGTITVAYTDVNNASQSFTSGNQSLAHTCILTITGTPAQGYDLTSLTVNGEAFTSGNTHVLSADATIAATFTAKVTTIEFDKEGGVGGSNTVQATYGENMPAIELPTRTGYEFGGYYDGDGGTNVQYYTATGESARTWNYGGDTKTLYAKWTAKKYTLVLDKNDGSSTTENVTVTFDAELPSITPDVTRAGYTWKGYNLSQDGLGKNLIKYDGGKYKFEGTVDGYTSSAKWVRDGGATAYAQWDAIKVSSISLNHTSLSKTVGDATVTLVATVSPDNALDKTVTWSSSDATVASVTSGGVVSFLKAGSATITATANDGSGKSKSCSVTVAAAVVPVTGVSLNKSATTLTVGGTETLTATVAPADATTKTVSWETSNSSVATVSNAGLVTAVAAGTATITVKSTADASKTATCTVTVSAGGGETVLYSWSSNKTVTEIGGVAKGYDKDGKEITDDINYHHQSYYTIRLDGNADWSTDYIKITLDQNIVAGDKIRITAYCYKDGSKKSSPKIYTADATAVKILEEATPFPDIKNSGTPEMREYTVPSGINSNSIKLTRYLTETNLFITKLEIVRPGSCTAPTITTDLSETEVQYDKGATATALSITATGTSVTYQWYSNNAKSTSGATSITGETTNSYTPSTATVGTIYYYCVASSGTCTTTSKIAKIKVNSTCTTPTISDISVTKSVVAETSGTTTASVTSNYPAGVTWSVTPDNVFTLGTPSTSDNTVSVTLTRKNDTEGSVTITAKVKGNGTTYCDDEISKTASISASSKPDGAYDITKASGITGGTIEIRQNGEEVTYAKKDQLITLTATPASGKTFDAWTVTMTESPHTAVTVTSNTFVMPNYAVTVSATFKNASGGSGTSCNEWGYGTGHTDVPTQSADVTIGNMTLVNRGCKSASKKAGDLFSGSEITTAITLGGKSQFVAGHLNGAEIKTVSFSAQGEGKNVFIAFCNEQNFVDNDSTHLLWYSLDTCHDVNNPNHHANARAFVTNNKANARITYTVGAPAGAKSFAIARNFVDIDSLNPEYVPTAAWQSSGSRALYYIKACGGSAAAVATPPAGIVRDTTINCGTTASIKLTAYGSKENNNTWYWQTSETGTDKTHSGATYSVSKAGTYYVRSYCVNPSNASEESWSAARSITVPSSAWTPLPEISDLCGSAGAATINYSQGDAGSKLYVEASNTSKVVWYSNSTASTTKATKLCDGELSNGKYYTKNAVSTATIGTTYYYCEIFNGTCAVTSPFVTVTIEEKTKTTKFSLVMKDQLADQSVAAKTSMAISSSLATIVNGTATLENMSSADGKAQILSDHINLAGSDGLVVVNLDYPLAQGDVITITNRISDNANQYALTATKERSTAIVTANDTYTIPASSPLIGIKTLYIWRSTTAISFIKTINVEIEGTLPCKGPKFTSITADHTTIGKGSTATLTAVVTPGASGKAITYKWYKDNVEISGATSDTYAFATTSSTEAKTYNFYCIAKEADCATEVKSTGIAITVTDCETPTIEWSSVPTNLRVGEGNGEATVETNRVAGVVYTSSDNAIATVSGNGTGKVTITPVTAGTVTITATVTGDGAVVCSGTEEVTQEITIAAAYEKYTIGYDFSVGGAFEDGVTAPTTVIRNEWNMIPVPKRSGYDFAGWTVSAGLSTDGYYNSTDADAGSTHIVYTCDVCTAGSNTAVYFKNIGATGGNVTLTPKWVATCSGGGSGAEVLDSETYKKIFTGSGSVTSPWSATGNVGSTDWPAIKDEKCLKLTKNTKAGIDAILTLTFAQAVHVKSIEVIHSFNSSDATNNWTVKALNASSEVLKSEQQNTVSPGKSSRTATIAFDQKNVKSLTFENETQKDMLIRQIIVTVVTKEAGSGGECYYFTYHASNANATGKTQDDRAHSKDEKVTLLNCTYLYDNHYCKGWATTREKAVAGTVDYQQGAEYTMPANNVELFAVWAEDSKTEPDVTWTPNPFPTTVYPGSKFDFTVQTSTDATLSVENLSAQNATLTDVQLNTTTKTFSATCNVPADATTDPVITLSTATGTTYRQNVANKELALQTCVGSGYQTIFFYNAKSTETALGTYAAEGGTAILSGKIMNGNDKQTISGQDYIQMRAGSNWVFQLDGDATFQAGDVITFTFAADAENERHTGVDLYLNLFNTNVPAGQTATIRYVVQSTDDGISEYIRGTNSLMMERANQYMKFGTVTVQRAMASTGAIQEPTLEFKDASGNPVADGSTITKKVKDIPFTISAYSNSVGEITYASYDEGVTTVDQSGEVASPTANGQTVITATVAAAGCYNAKTIFYKLVVNSVDCNVIPQITTEPTPQTKLIGETVELTVVAENASSYQWYSCDDTEESNTEIIDGANSATYSFTAKEVGRQYYFCKVSSSCANTVKTEPNFVEINPLPYTITYTAGVVDGKTHTEAEFTANKTTTEPTYIKNLSNYFFVNGAAIHGAANGTMSSTIKIPSTRTETNYTGFNFNVLESYYLTVSKCSLNVAAVGTTGIQVQAILSDNHDHMISSAIKTITEGVDQSVAIEFPNLDVQLVDQVTMKILAWYDDANAYIRIGEVTGIDGEIYSLPEPTIQWTSVPKDGAAGKDMLIAAESNNTLNKITYTSSNTAVATISDVEDVDAKRLSYIADGTSTISASIKGDGVNFFNKVVTISQPITVTTVPSDYKTVTCFTSDGSKIYATYTQTKQGEALSFMEPVNEGYTFAGWYDKEGTLVIAKGATYAPTEDISVYAHWTPITYHIAYTLNGGEQCEEQPTEYTIESNEVTFCSPERTGFTFLGWYNNADFTGDVVTSIAKGSYGDVNLYARWQATVESACINFGSWLFENNMTVGQKPAHAVSTTGTTYSAFAVDQINFSSQKITYESGTGEFGGWKINTKGATITFCVDNDCAVSIRTGQLKSDVTITYTDGAGDHNATLKANTTNSFSVKGETTVTLTIADSKTVVLKEITVTDPCSVEPAYTIIRKHFDKKQTVAKTEIGSITLAGPGVEYTLKSISGDGNGLTATFNEDEGKMYIAGETDNLTRKTITMNVTYTFQNNCTPKKTFDVVIPIDIYAGNPKLAYIVDGEQDGDWDDYNKAHAEGTELFEKLKQNFDVYPVNCYTTVDEDAIKEHYAQFDVLLMTDYPNTNTTKTINKKKYSYSNAVGCMVDVKPILTFESFVANLDNWHIGSNPKSPEGADATNQMTLLCNANEILTEQGFGVGEVITMADELPSPSMQGFVPKEAPDFIFIATIPRVKGSTTDLLITCCERQTNIKARMVVLGMQSNTYEVISEKGYQAVRGLLNYLLLDENIPDCSLIFHGQDATNTSWNTEANWEGNIIPSELSPVRIDAPCVVDINGAKAGTVKINQKLNDEEVQLQGSLTVNPTAALTVTKFVRTMTVETPEPHATAVSDLHILSNEHGNGALIFDNANGDTRATVDYYSVSSGESNGKGGLTNAQWQWMTTPFNDVKDAQYNYYGAWMRRYDNATHNWIDMYNGCSMTPFGGYELTQYGTSTYVMQGTLATTANQTIKLAPYLNVIGNSWTAPINISQFTTDDFTNAEATIVMLNTGLDEKGTGTVTEAEDASTADVRTAGTYVSIPVKVASVLKAPFKVIPSMQSFQVRAGGEGGSLTLNYDRLVRTSNVNIQPMRAPGRAASEQNEENGINESLRIYVQGNKYGDYLYLFQHDGTTMEFDNGWDGRKFRSSNLAIPTLMARSGTDNWHISTQPQFAGTQIAFYQGEDNFYTIGFDYSGYETLWFYDNVTDQYTEINNENTYVFISNTTKLQKRFEIRDYNPNAIEVTTGNKEVESSESGVQKVILHEKLYILNQGHVYDAQGKQVK